MVIACLGGGRASLRQRELPPGGPSATGIATAVIRSRLNDDNIGTLHIDPRTQPFTIRSASTSSPRPSAASTRKGARAVWETAREHLAGARDQLHP
jgi:hypothetical protein